MLARPELLLPLAFSVSGLMIVVALLLLRVGARPGRRVHRVVGASSAQSRAARAQTMVLGSSAGIGVRTDSSPRPKRSETLQLFSGATVAALEQATRSNPSRKRRMRMYS